MRLIFAFVATLVLVAPLFALTPTEITASQIFDVIIEKSTSRTTGFVFEQSTQMMGMTITGSGRGTYALPKSRTDLTFETPIGNIAVRTISDGKTLWQIEETPLGKKAVKHDLSNPTRKDTGPVDPFMAFAGVKTREFLDAVLDNFDAEVLGIDQSTDPPVYIVRLTPYSTDQNVPSMQFRIGFDDAFPRQMNVYNPDGTLITKMTITKLDFDVTPDEGTFTYEPGPDYQVVNAATAMPPQLATPDTEPNLEGRVAPNFTLADLSGREIELSSLRGQHVLIDFWASWCPPCKKALPHIQSLADGTRGLVVLTVNAEPPSVTRGFVERHGYSFTTLVDADRHVSASYDVTAIPTTFIIAPDGTVARHMVGYHTESQLRQALVASGVSF